MSSPFIAQIVMFGGNFAPRGWAFCEGQLLSISQNTALFSILGTTYGGDGRTSFALPDLRGRQAIQPGTGPGLPTYRLGQRGGNYEHTMTVNQMPNHNHTASFAGAAAGLPASTEEASESTPAAGLVLAATTAEIYTDESPNTTLAGPDAGGTVTVNNNGGQQAFNIMDPFLAVNYIIALQGIFPSRN